MSQVNFFPEGRNQINSLLMQAPALIEKAENCRIEFPAGTREYSENPWGKQPSRTVREWLKKNNCRLWAWSTTAAGRRGLPELFDNLCRLGYKPVLCPFWHKEEFSFLCQTCPWDRQGSHQAFAEAWYAEQLARYQEVRAEVEAARKKAGETEAKFAEAWAREPLCEDCYGPPDEIVLYQGRVVCPLHFWLDLDYYEPKK